MKRAPSSILVLSLILLAAIPDGVAAADAGVGVVDSRILARDSRVGKQALDRIKTLGEQLQADIRARQETLEKELLAFRERAPMMSMEERDRKRDDLERRGLEIKRSAEDAQRKIEREGKRTEEEVQRKVLEGVQGFAKQNGYTVVLDRLQCLYNAPGTDITQDVLGYLDSTSPSLD